jgi:hypothetical protein
MTKEKVMTKQVDVFLSILGIVGLAVLLAACGEDQPVTQSKTCTQPNPQGCNSDTDCSDGQRCLPSESCQPSLCACDETSGEWECTADCGGGVCGSPEEKSCSEDSDCVEGAEWCIEGSCQACVDDPCKIACEEGTELYVRNGCHVCECVPMPECPAPRPGGCVQKGCPEGEVCDTTQGCTSSSCTCTETGWLCTPDCNGGICVPAGASCASDSDCVNGEEWCTEGHCVPCDNSGLLCDLACEQYEERNGCFPCRCAETPQCTEPNPAGCVVTGCDDGEVCDPRQGCTSSACDCMDGEWVCTPDCAGGLCMPAGAACERDADCAFGSQWCVDGACVDCDNSGTACFLACTEGEELEERNGCHPCNCVPVNECQSDADCSEGVCQPGQQCLMMCPLGDPSCCYGNQCVPGSGGACSSDSDCEPGKEWCEGGRCVTCDNSGLQCKLGCEEGEELEVRNECHPCNCVPISDCRSDADCGEGLICQPGQECVFICPAGDPSCCFGNRCVGGSGALCTTDEDCGFGAEWCEGGRCVTCDNTGELCDLACTEGFVFAPERHGCQPCACVPE